MSLRGGPKIVTDGLILALDAGNERSYSGTGSSWVDLISGESAIGYNSPTIGDSYFNFDGASDYFRFSRSDINGGSFDYDICSIYIWIRPSSTGGDGLISNNVFTIENTVEISIGRRTSAYSGIAYASNPWAWRQINSDVLVNGSWNLITYVHRLDSRLVYANGVLVYTSSDTGALAVGSTTYPYLTIGGRFSGTGSSLEGDIGIVKMYNVAHDVDEVLQNYNEMKSRFE